MLRDGTKECENYDKSLCKTSSSVRIVHKENTFIVFFDGKNFQAWLGW